MKRAPATPETLARELARGLRIDLETARALVDTQLTFAAVDALVCRGANASGEGSKRNTVTT